MTSLTLQLDNVELCSNKSDCDTSEQITKLFPKCRPRSDVNLNPIIISTNTTTTTTINQEHELTNTDAISDTVMNIERNTDRIIEIAGGREIFSHSRSKASRKSRNVFQCDDYDKKKTSKSCISQGVWELRGNCGEAKKLRTANDFTETIFSTEVSSVRHQKPDINKHGNCPQPPVRRTSPNKNEPTLINRDIVVFDDIDEAWKDTTQVDFSDSNKCEVNDIDLYENSSVGTSPVSPVSHQQNFIDFVKGMISDLDETPESESGNKITKVIGNLPIAVYEGSPRRYGPRHVDSIQSHPTLPSAHSLLASPSVYPPRPGFPQRVICTPTEPESMSEVPVTNLEKSTTTAPTTFDYLYEFSETRKVLEEFFKYPSADEEKRYESDFQDLDYELRRQANGDGSGSSYVGQRLAKSVGIEQNDLYEHENLEHENNFLDLSVGTGSSGDLGETEVGLQVGHSRNFTLSPETTDCDSNCGDLDSEVSLMLMDELVPSVGLLGSTDLGMPTDSARLYSSMPVLEDGLSSGHASDTDNNNPTVMLMKKQITEIEREIIHKAHNDTNTKNKHFDIKQENGIISNKDCVNILPKSSPIDMFNSCGGKTNSNFSENEIKENNVDTIVTSDITPPPPAPAPHRSINEDHSGEDVEAAIKDIRLTLQRTKVLPLKSVTGEECEENTVSPVWVPRQRGLSGTSGDSDVKKAQSGEEAVDEEEADTDLETDRLLGQQRTDDQGFFDDKGWRKPKSRTIMPPNNLSKNLPTTPKQIIPVTSTQIINNNSCDTNMSCQNIPDIPISSPPCSPMARDSASEKTSSPQSQKGSTSSSKQKDKESKKKSRNKEGLYDPSVLIEGVLFRARYLGSTQLVCEGQPTKTTRMMQAEEAVSRIKEVNNQISNTYRPSKPFYDDNMPIHEAGCIDNKIVENYMDDNELLQAPQVNQQNTTGGATGTVFRLQFLGSVEVEEEGGKKRRKRLKKSMVEEAVLKIKAPDGETQPSTEVDLFISTEKIMVLNTDLKEIMMDHALRTISYIADIGDLVVLMARRRFVPHEMEDPPKINRTPKMICHVFESDEAQFIAQSIGQAFQVAYMEFLKANGIEDHSFVKEMDYQEVLNSQEIFGDELQMFAKKEMQKEVVVPKAKGEILGVVIVESGWGSMLPTVVIANLAPAGAAARCGQLNIGDQIIAINGVSLVGLPLSTCQNYIKNSKNQTVVKLTVVPCAPVVEVKIKRPDTKYQLGFSVQNGVICSLLRGGIAERGGVRVGHRIIEINNQSVVAVPHEKIVNLLATSVGEILMKTMPTSMFRLLTGQENPVYI